MANSHWLKCSGY